MIYTLPAYAPLPPFSKIMRSKWGYTSFLLLYLPPFLYSSLPPVKRIKVYVVRRILTRMRALTLPQI